MRQRTTSGPARLKCRCTRRRLRTWFAAVGCLGSASSRFRLRVIRRGSLKRRRFLRLRQRSGFVDPRNIVAPLVAPTRVERSVPLKALVAQINYNLFDIELGQQQSQFAYLQAKDLADTVDGVLRTHDVALWNGNDTSLSSPTTAQYFGAAGQIAAGGNTRDDRHEPEHCGRLQVDGGADGFEQLVWCSSDGDLCQPGAAGPDRSRDEVGVQRGVEHEARSTAA